MSSVFQYNTIYSVRKKKNDRSDPVQAAQFREVAELRRDGTRELIIPEVPKKATILNLQ